MQYSFVVFPTSQLFVNMELALDTQPIYLITHTEEVRIVDTLTHFTQKRKNI